MPVDPASMIQNKIATAPATLCKFYFPNLVLLTLYFFIRFGFMFGGFKDKGDKSLYKMISPLEARIADKYLINKPLKTDTDKVYKMHCGLYRRWQQLRYGKGT